MFLYLIILFISGWLYACENSNIDCQYSDTLNNCKSHSIFIPRQLSYNPIYENNLTFSRSVEHRDWDYILAIKPIYTQSVGCKFKRYFNIGHQDEMLIREDGTGDINSVWFQVTSYNLVNGVTPYSSTLRFCPVRKTFGALLYFEMDLPCNYWFSVNTAAIRASNDMNLQELNITQLGSVVGFATMKDSFASSQRLYGKVGCKRHKSGLDDIQLKLIKRFFDTECWMWDFYGLIGIPTGSGSKAEYLFEPLVGSRHAQIGLGTNFYKEIRYYDCGKISFQGEIKWRYGLKGSEYRSFDLKNNGEWSRYLLLEDYSSEYSPFFATNGLTLKSSVTPKNSIDVYLALHCNRDRWQFELGYDFWYRSRESISVKNCDVNLGNFGIADWVSYTILSPTTASTTNISEGGTLGADNLIVSDNGFVALSLSDLNLNSAAQPRGISNSIYGSIGYLGNYGCYPVEVGFNVSYELGHDINTPNNFSVWTNLDFGF